MYITCHSLRQPFAELCMSGEKTFVPYKKKIFPDRLYIYSPRRICKNECTKLGIDCKNLITGAIIGYAKMDYSTFADDDSCKIVLKRHDQCSDGLYINYLSIIDVLAVFCKNAHDNFTRQSSTQWRPIHWYLNSSSMISDFRRFTECASIGILILKNPGLPLHGIGTRSRFGFFRTILQESSSAKVL